MFPYEEELLLDGAWQLGYLPHAAYCALGSPPTTGEEIALCKIPTLGASVPGNVELDFQRAGLIDDPLTGDHILQTRPMEVLHYWYIRRFSWQGDGAGDEAILLEGVDTYAEVYLNGEKIGETDNMLIPHLLPAGGLRTGTNEIVVHLCPTVIKAREYDYPLASQALEYSYDGLFVRKAPYMFGWDIMPRLVSAGLWKSVRLMKRLPRAFTQCYLYTCGLCGADADMALFYELELGNAPCGLFRVRLTMTLEEQRVVQERPVWGKAGKLRFRLPDAKLWWPRGRGEAALYQVRVELLEGDTAVARQEFRTGVRTVNLRYSPHTAEDKGEFQFEINGERLFILGTNWVPLSPFPSQNAVRMERGLALAEEAGCNAIRCWGGNVYESDAFFDLCDEKGILVWQDFAMACGVYPNDEAFLRRMEKECRSVIRRLRRHPSLCLWAGDNECDDGRIATGFLHNDPNDNRLTRELIPRLIREEDFTRPFLPSSPYRDKEVFRQGGLAAVEEHLWGDRLFFKTEYYLNSPARFASEIGYHGCPSPESVRRFIDEDHLWPCQGDAQWLYHASSPEADERAAFGYRIGLMQTQIRNMFGREPQNLTEFALCSQISQAEAMKLFIERFRTEKWEKTGIIWWNILDGCPQFSDAVVDYYYQKKLAFFYIQTAQSPLLLAMRDNQGQLELIGVNDTRTDELVHFEVWNMAGGAHRVCEGEQMVRADSCTRLLFPDQAESGAFYHIRWNTAGGLSGSNHYYAGSYPVDLYAYLDAALACGALRLEGFPRMTPAEERAG